MAANIDAGGSGSGSGSGSQSIRSGSAVSADSAASPAGCPHLATDAEGRLSNLVLEAPSQSGAKPPAPPLLKDVLHRFATGVRWGKKIRSGQVRPEQDDDNDEDAQHHFIDDKTALKRRKLLPHPTCVQCGLVLHRPFICLTCASTACFFQEYGAAADQGLLRPTPNGTSTGSDAAKVKHECHIASHLHTSQHPLAFDMHRGTLFCRLCDDIVYDARFEKVFDLEVNMAASTYRLKGKRAKHLNMAANQNDEVVSQAHSKSGALPRGFRNMGMTCFMNVILQSFLHNPLLRNYFLADRHNSKLCASRENCLACEMDKLFAEFYNSANISADAEQSAASLIPPSSTNGRGSRAPTPIPMSATGSGVGTPNGPTPYGPTTFLFTIWLTRESAEISQAGQHDAHELFISTLNGLHASLMAPPTAWSGSSRSPQRSGGVSRGSISQSGGAGGNGLLQQHGGGSTLSRPRARNKRLPTFPAEDRASLPRRWNQLEEIPQNGIYPADEKRALIEAAGAKRKRGGAYGDQDDDEDEEDDDEEDEEYFLHPAFSSSSLNDSDSAAAHLPPLTPGLSGLNANACPCVVHRTFAGTIQSDVTCLHCKSTNSTRDPMLDLSLDLRSTRGTGKGDGSGSKNGKGGNGANGKKKGAAAPDAGLGKKKWTKKGDGPAGQDSPGPEGSSSTLGIAGLADDEQHLLTCLERYCSPEALGPQQYTCAQCGSQGGATKQLSLYRLPPVLCIQLKRFEHEHKNGSTGPVKIDVRVRFSLSLDLREFVTSSVRAQGKGIQEDPEAYIYDLFTVIVHEGSMNTGHYTNFSKRQDGWYRFNDDKITSASISEVLSARAYQLCYVRRQLYNVRPDTVHLA